MKFRKCSLLVLLFPALFLLCFVLPDPFGVCWRKEPKIFFTGGMRIMGANAINSGKFDSYILGTSMMENTSAREAEALFNDGSRFANISAGAYNFFERSFPLEYICKRGAKNIIYSLDSGSYINLEMENEEYLLKNFGYLYDNSRLNNFKVYFSMLSLRSAARQLILRENFSEGFRKDYDMPGNWFANIEHSQRFGGLDKWFAAKNNWQIKGALASIVRSSEEADLTPLAEARFSDEDLARIDLAKEYCNEYVIRFVEENPSTQFYVFFPPYSRISFAILYQSDKAAALIHQQIARYFAEMGARHDNLHVFGFETQGFLDDIALYKDTGHYHPDVNSSITAAMAAGTNKITPQNVDEYLSVSEELALSFDLKGLAEEISEYLESGQ